MRNDLTYLRFYWDQLEDEVLDDDIPDEVIHHLADLLEAVAFDASGKDISVDVFRPGPPRHGCIEIAYEIVFQCATDDPDRASQIAYLGSRTNAFRQQINDNEGLVGLAALLWAVLIGRPLWDFWIRQGRNPSQTPTSNSSDELTPPSNPIPIPPVAPLDEERLVKEIHRVFADDLDRIVSTILRATMQRVEMQYLDNPPATLTREDLLDVIRSGVTTRSAGDRPAYDNGRARRQRRRRLSRTRGQTPPAATAPDES